MLTKIGTILTNLLVTVTEADSRVMSIHRLPLRLGSEGYVSPKLIFYLPYSLSSKWRTGIVRKLRKESERFQSKVVARLAPLNAT